jgi:hypothetical protein
MVEKRLHSYYINKVLDIETGPSRDFIFLCRAEPRLENSRVGAETETFEKRVSRSLEDYITGIS